MRVGLLDFRAAACGGRFQSSQLGVKRHIAKRVARDAICYGVGLFGVGAKDHDARVMVVHWQAAVVLRFLHVVDLQIGRTGSVAAANCSGSAASWDRESAPLSE